MAKYQFFCKKASGATNELPDVKPTSVSIFEKFD